MNSNVSKWRKKAGMFRIISRIAHIYTISKAVYIYPRHKRRCSVLCVILQKDNSTIKGGNVEMM